jgi:hypothetical protein
MKPTSLKTGDRIIKEGIRHPLIFVKRVRKEGSRPAINVFHCAAFVGLDGPDDRGICTVFDSELKHYRFEQQ